MSYKKFYTGIKWNLSGSILYETMRVAHQLFLLNLMSITSYGRMGTLFSIIFLTINLADFGGSVSLPPFLKTFTQSKHNFKRLFGGYLLMEIPVLFIGAAVVSWFYREPPLSPIIPFLIICLEGVRIIFRLLLHTAFLNKATIIIETTLILVYYLLVWVPYYFFDRPLTLKLIFEPYLITSLLTVLGFLIITWRFYQDLSDKTGSTPPGIWKRIFKARLFNYSSRITQNFFTGNFLIPLFAYKFGLAQAGVFKFASYIADSIRGIIHVSIGFSGGALLSNLKDSSLQKKREAFYLLSEKLNKIIYFLLIFLAVNFKPLLELNNTIYQTSSIITFTFFFLLLAFLEKLFVVYDQFYITEELSEKLFLIKSFELVLFYVIALWQGNFSPIFILVGLVLIRLICFIILTINAYILWKIKPYLKTSWKFIIISSILALVTRYILAYTL